MGKVAGLGLGQFETFKNLSEKRSIFKRLIFLFISFSDSNIKHFSKKKSNLTTKANVDNRKEQIDFVESKSKTDYYFIKLECIFFKKI